MRRIVIALLLLPLTIIAQERNMPLSETATASIITCGPGDDFYATFGHSAIRICDTAQGIDWVYNYGTFDFDTPHFYWKFAQGMLNYCLSRTSFMGFMAEYDYEGRWVEEQRLHITQQEVNNLYVALEWNYRPENRYYRYDFFRDNCATRVRDMVEGCLSHRKVQYGTTNDGKPSYREAMASFTDDTQLWWVLGVDMLLGARTDRKCDTRDQMYLPVLMLQNMTPAMVGDDLLTGCSWNLLEEHRTPMKRSFPPVVAFSLVFLVVALLSCLGWKRGWSLVWLDRTLFIVAGLAGAFLVFMWVGTDHWCTRWNLNLLWASPLFLLLAIRPQNCPKWSLWLQGGMLAVALLVAVIGWPQHLNVATIPLILMLVLRVGIRCTDKYKE